MLDDNITHNSYSQPGALVDQGGTSAVASGYVDRL